MLLEQKETSTVKIRRCIIAGCDGRMRPTREMLTFGGNVEKPLCRIFRCTVCGNERPWVAAPYMNGSFAELHCIAQGEWSCVSMASDPLMNRPKKPRRTK